MSKRDLYGEQSASKRLGGKQRPSSGRFWNAKGDFLVDQDLFDRKETKLPSYTIQRSHWMKLMIHAVKEGKSPALQIHFLPEGLIPGRTLIVIPEERYIELLNGATEGKKITETSPVGEILRDLQTEEDNNANVVKTHRRRPNAKRSVKVVGDD